MKLASLIRENIDIGDVLYSNRAQIELDFGPRTFKTLQSSLMMDDEAYVRSWLIKNGYMEEEKMPFEEIYDSPREDYVVVDKRNLRPLKMNYGSGQFYEKWSTKEKAQADANELNNAYKKTYGAVEGPHVVMYKSDYYSKKRNLNEAIDPALMEQIAAGLLLILGPLGIKFGFDQLIKLADKYVSPAIDRFYGKVGAGAKFLSKNLSTLRDAASKGKEALEIKLQDLLMTDDLNEVNYPTPEIEEGTCGYNTDAKTGKKLKTPGGLK